ncbi:tyrosine-protein kinase receptor [Epargyreus clarus]|uniref:tyrosine-protein kinase receptor n=1 Tax=Epargyreus clarus TaxID=520877 RepID=UPI003C2AC28B
MALGRLVFLFAVVAVVSAGYHEVEAENKAKKAVAAKKEQSSRSANPAPVRGSFQELTSLMNRTEDRHNRRRGKHNFNKLKQLNNKYKSRNDGMMNDNEEGAISVNQKTSNENDSNSLADKMKVLRREGPTYEAVNKYSYIPQVTGVFCNFETLNGSLDMCMWEWNTTVSSHGLGFRVVTAADVVAMNQTTRGLKFSGPDTDADGHTGGHFLYLPVDPTMENMVIKSPPFRGLWEFCKFEARLHQSKMQNASIRLISESTMSGVQWILQEVAGDNLEFWQPFRFMIGKVQQEIRIIIEISRPSLVSLAQPLPHIAVDNIRMVECLPEPPVFNGECQHGQLKCRIMSKESCIKLQQVCDLVKDCDDGIDERQNCDKMPFGSYCNFEQDTCGFENVPQPILKWSRHNGPTPTDKTGPNYDHTCGPPDPYSTVIPMVHSLFPAHMNYSMVTCVGYYFFVNMNVTGPNQERADFASTAVMKTIIFNPPPKVHGNITSQYYNCCMIRFYYQQNGRNYGSLSVDVVEITSRGNISTSVWFSTKDKGENWYRAAIFLPNVTRRYYLQFKTRMGMRIYSDSAIDDFSMAPECFGLNMDPKEIGDYNYYDPIFEEKTTPHEGFVDEIYYRFSTCGATGRYGPSQAMCDAAYNNTPAAVTVLDTPPYEGVQVWDVPEEGWYTIIATGASGGLGSAWSGVSHGAQAIAFVELHKGERLHMLIGQQGHNACKKTLSAQESQECSRRINDTQLFTSKTHEVRNTQVTDGGGGGGGGTYVFLLDKESQPIPLMVAGGGGGLSVGVFVDDGSQHAHTPAPGPPESGYMYGAPGRTSGAGGGWIARSGPSTPGFERVRGAALREGGAGGRACSGVAHGGFGGGGGGCLRGGGGGGWIGGNTNEAEGRHGGGGWSFLDSSRAERPYSRAGLAARTGPGEVLVIPAVHSCGCSYRCVALNEYRSEVTCYCPKSWTSDDSDPTKCVLQESWLEKHLFLLMTIGAVASISFIFSMFFIACHFYNAYQRKRQEEISRKRLLEQDVQLRRLRPAAGNENPLGMAFNPHYGAEAMLQGIDVRGLPKVARESLKLVKALGQGAFGEVYQGLYRHRTGDTLEMPVAVKTLPELSTGQAESDFLMEAAIMAKFSHPNIVHLIGVCFDRHPRFIVLELLAGGDLKTFLRESRPRPERASALTMKDLLLCSVDVCKGCRYLETQRFIHRDIAARNCLLTSRGPGRCVKIADFGMARDIYRSDYYKKGGKAMLPIKWMPPEAYIDGLFTIKTDVWSFGVLLWEVFSLGVMPYTGCSNREVMDMVSGGGRLDKPYGCPQEVYRLMCDCWNPSPNERPSFAAMFEKLQRFSKDPEITNAPLPVARSLHPQTAEVQVNSNGSTRSLAGDYLVPMEPQDPTPDVSPTDQLVPHSISPTAAPEEEEEDSECPLPAKASLACGSARAAGAARGACAASAETRSAARFLPSNSTDRLLSSVEGTSLEDDSASDLDSPTGVRETSFTTLPLVHPPVHTPVRPATPGNPPRPATPGNLPVRPETPGDAPQIAKVADKVEKVKPSTPTTPKPPENALSIPTEPKVIDKTNKTLAPEKKTAPIASPDPPRINAWNMDPPKIAPKLKKPLCLDPAQLEKDLNDLKKNSGSVNLNTMNIVPPYIHVVTPNKFSESKTIQIDPKKAVIHDLPTPDSEDDKGKMKSSGSAASLLNGPMTDVPYADSDNTSSGSGNGQNLIINQKNKSYEVVGNGNRGKLIKQGSNGGIESEINC